MSDEMCGHEDAAQDAEACAEALESLDRIALGEIALDDAEGGAQDEPEADGEQDADGGAVLAKDEAGHEDSESEADDQPESDTS